jgi:hypothetical protein
VNEDAEARKRIPDSAAGLLRPNPTLGFSTMNTAQRIVLIIYGLLLIYCCFWVTPPGETQFDHTLFWHVDLGGRLLAVTAIAGPIFLLAGKWRSR